MGDLLERYKFTALSNPFGTVYNPLSIHQLLLRAAENRQVTTNELVEYQGIYSHYDFHSEFSGLDPEAVVSRINEQIGRVADFLPSCDTIIMTYGTAFSYRLTNGKGIVSNCHKHPGHWFDRVLLTPEEVVQDFRELRNTLPSVRFILSVSPVRHTRDTLPLNNVSKSILRYATHQLAAEDTDYFPSFEIMMDDLRDYRFYDRDLIHPSQVAEEYIWSKFLEVYVSEDDQSLLRRTASLQKQLAHRPNHPGSAAYRTFLDRMKSEAEALSAHIDLSPELSEIRDKIASL